VNDDADRASPPPAPGEPTEEMLRAVYAQLRSLAHARLRNEGGTPTLRSTELVHEAYLRLAAEGAKEWANRAQFFSAAAEAMRRILIDRARARGRDKRGGVEGRPAQKLQLTDLGALDLAIDYDLEQIVALDRALEQLQEVDARGASVVRLRFYAGLSIDEAAEVLGVTARTVKRDWTFARAWLFGALGGSPSPQ
jgi:RNA polymerase sigma factor (TIGR02999 family)